MDGEFADGKFWRNRIVQMLFMAIKKSWQYNNSTFSANYLLSARDIYSLLDSPAFAETTTLDITELRTAGQIWLKNIPEGM